MGQEELLEKAVNVIARAIHKHLAITFRDVNNEKQVVEPFVLGIQKGTNKYILKCYKTFPLETSDTSEHWVSIEIDKLHDIQVMPVRAKPDRGSYGKLKADIEEVVACVKGYEDIFT